MSFDQLGLSAGLLRAVQDQGYDQPTPIQLKAIPEVIKGVDLLAAAQTGTGKTAAFALPLIDRLSANMPSGQGTRPIRVLVLTPTRELAAQVRQSFVDFSGHLPLRSAVIFGGVGQNPQVETLRRGIDILVATPGRLLDLAQQGHLKLGQVETLVLDEADRMLDMGFIHDIKKILKLLPAKRQNLLFSATFANEIRRLAAELLTDPVEVDVAPRNSTAEGVEQEVYAVDNGGKSDLLAELIDRHSWHQVLVFTRTKHGANRLAKKLDKFGIPAAAIHGNKSQNARTKALADFKGGKVQTLVATDIAARGLDISGLPRVVNFDLPNVPEDYVHRIGRTGRAGATGHAVSLVSPEDAPLLKDIERLIKRQPARQVLEGFEPAPTVAAALEYLAGQPGGGQRRGGRSSGGRSGGGRSGGGQGRGGNGGRSGQSQGQRAQGGGSSGSAASSQARRRRRPSGAGQTSNA